MKTRLLLFFAMAAACYAASPHIKIGDLVLYRPSPATDSKEELREYLPEGEKFEHWTKLASVRVFKDLKDPVSYLKNVVAAVTKSHPLARYQVLQDQKTKEVILDFTTFPPASAPEQFAEWNLMRAQFVKGKGLVVYQYAMRIYDLDSGASEKLKAERTKMVGPFSIATFEEEKA